MKRENEQDEYQNESTKQISRRDFFSKAIKTSAAGLLITASGGIINPSVARADGAYQWVSNNPQPYILPRDAWGASDPLNPIPSRNTSLSNNLIFHHSGSLTFYSTDQVACINKIHSIQQEQMSSGWDDIAYHYLIDPAGRIWAGRYTYQLGGHCTSYNNDIGICILGNYDSQSLNSSQINAIKSLAAWRIRIQGIWKTNTFGHKDFSSTACPGTNIESYVTGSLRTYLSSVIY